jgi:hypothetical protein
MPHLEMVGTHRPRSAAAALPTRLNNRVSGKLRMQLAVSGPTAVDDYLGRRGSIMATMISEVYDAFIASGAPEDKARAAAVAMSAYDGRFNGIEHEIGLIRGDINFIRGDINIIRGDINIVHGDVKTVRGEINTVRGEINLLKWMNGITWALSFGILFKLFLH